MLITCPTQMQDLLLAGKKAPAAAGSAPPSFLQIIISTGDNLCRRIKLPKALNPPPEILGCCMSKIHPAKLTFRKIESTPLSKTADLKPRRLF